MVRGNRFIKKGLLASGIVFILFASTVHASESLQVTLSRADIYFNGNPGSPSEDLPLLNYKDRTYVPLRYLSENSGAWVGYDNDNKVIHIDTEYSGEFRSQVTDVKRDGDFELALRSNKSTYAYGEALSIWSELTYNGESELNVNHGGQLLSFSVLDSEGVGVGQFITAIGLSTEMKKHDAFMLVFPDSLAVSYQVEKNQITDPIAFFDSAKRPGRLEPGKYTVYSRANFTIGDRVEGERKEMLASLDITITS